MRAAAVAWSSAAQLARRRPETRALHGLWRLAMFIVDLPRTHPRIDTITGLALSPTQALGDEVAPAFGAAIRGALSAGAEVIAQAEDAGSLGSPDAAARMIELWMALQGPVRLRKLARVVPEMGADHGTRIARALFLAWGAPKKGLESARKLAEATATASDS
ncbi:MAG: hypothetical protein AB8I08_20175 [Sandaracinaceae bacterium]